MRHGQHLISQKCLVDKLSTSKGIFFNMKPSSDARRFRRHAYGYVHGLYFATHTPWCPGMSKVYKEIYKDILFEEQGLCCKLLIFNILKETHSYTLAASSIFLFQPSNTILLCVIPIIWHGITMSQNVCSLQTMRRFWKLSLIGLWAGVGGFTQLPEDREGIWCWFSWT